MKQDQGMIELLYARSSSTGSENHINQTVEFALQVNNIGYAKEIVIHWLGEDGGWHRLPAVYRFQAGPRTEYWSARRSMLTTPPKQRTPDIHFAVQYKVAGSEYWDNNDNRNYLLPGDNGLILGKAVSLCHVGFRNRLLQNERIFPVQIVSRNDTGIRNVSVRWSADDWKSFRQTDCRPLSPSLNASPSSRHSIPAEGNATTTWQGLIEAGDNQRIEYAFCCHTDAAEIWENNGGLNYRVGRDVLRVMTLNLHCFQEEDQDGKFSTIARAIEEHDIHIICFQEAAEERSEDIKRVPVNAARVIRDRLYSSGLFFYLHWDWSHIGFGRYREGSAILSRFPLAKCAGRYVSASSDTDNIHARKVVMAAIEVPSLGRLNIFSVHLSWRQAGFRQQFEKLCRWAREEESESLAATLLCGDFNTVAGSEGYLKVIAGSGFEDQHLRVTAADAFFRIFRGSEVNADISRLDSDRIDYILMNRESRITPISSRRIFTGSEYDRVSDHPGYLAEFRWKDSL